MSSWEQINDFLSVADIDWTPGKARGEGAEYLTEMLGYLSAACSSLSVLSQELCDRAYVVAYEYIGANILSDLLTGEGVPFNRNAVLNLESDMATVREYAAMSPAVNLEKSFEHVDQLVLLFKDDDWDAYLSDSMRERRFPKLSIPDVLRLIELYKGSGLGFSMIKESRARSKAVEALQAKLQQQ